MEKEAVEEVPVEQVRVVKVPRDVIVEQVPAHYYYYYYYYYYY